MKSRPTLWLKRGVLSLLMLAVFVPLLLCPFVWLPDIFSDRTITIAEMMAADGDCFRVTQRFAGDGYATRFEHHGKLGKSWDSTLDGDAQKMWRAHISKTNQVLRIQTPRHTTFFYNPITHELTDANGVSHAVFPH